MLKLSKSTQKIQTKSVEESTDKRGILFGTGMTKKLVEQANKKTALNELSKDDANRKKSPFAALTKKKVEAIDTLPDEKVEAEDFKHAHELKFVRKSEGITLDEDQIAARDGLRKQQFGVLIGSAGTGKTTTTDALVAQLEEELPQTVIQLASGEEVTTPHIIFCSFTGRAVQQLKSAIPEKYHQFTDTIHAVLEYGPEWFEIIDPETGEPKTTMRFVPHRTEANPLTCKAIVVDESGTVPVDLWHNLLEALPKDCRILLLGDINQLKPVMGHSVLGFAMNKWPTYELTKLHRNAGPIAKASFEVLQGRRPTTDTETKKVITKAVSNGSLTCRKEILGIMMHLYNIGQFDPMQDGLIVPQNVGAIGQEELNGILVNHFNPPVYNPDGSQINRRIVIRAGFQTKSFAVGDKVMLTQNTQYSDDLKLTNGMQGVIEEINLNNAYSGNHHEALKNMSEATFSLEDFETQLQEEAEHEVEDETKRAASHTVTIKFPELSETITFATTGEVNALTLSYAFTCHKAQGSEFRNVIVVVHSANHMMLSREWLYTAMTRAKNRLFVLYNERGLQKAIKTQLIKGKTVKEKAQKFMDLENAAKDESPCLLPAPYEYKEIKLKFK